MTYAYLWFINIVCPLIRQNITILSVKNVIIESNCLQIHAHFQWIFMMGYTLKLLQRIRIRIQIESDIEIEQVMKRGMGRSAPLINTALFPPFCNLAYFPNNKKDLFHYNEEHKCSDGSVVTSRYSVNMSCSLGAR